MEKNTYPQGILWDMDGVLADTTETHFFAWKTALAEVGIELEKDRFLDFFGRSPSDTLKGLVGTDFSHEEKIFIHKRKIELYNEAVKANIRSTPGIKEWLRFFNTSTPQAVASSAPLEDIQFILKRLDYLDYFKSIISGSSLQQSKPAPDIFLMAANELGVNPKYCLVIEDSPNGIEAARAANIPVIAIRTSYSEEKLSNANLILANLSELTYAMLRDFCKKNY